MNLELVELAEKINDLSKVEKKEFYLYIFDSIEEILESLPKDSITYLLGIYIPHNNVYWELREKDEKIEKLEKQIKLLETK